MEEGAESEGVQPNGEFLGVFRDERSQVGGGEGGKKMKPVCKSTQIWEYYVFDALDDALMFAARKWNDDGFRFGEGDGFKLSEDEEGYRLGLLVDYDLEKQGEA